MSDADMDHTYYVYRSTQDDTISIQCEQWASGNEALAFANAILAVVSRSSDTEHRESK